MPVRILGGALFLLVAASCGRNATPPGDATRPSGAQTAFRITIAPSNPNGPVYIEGALRYVHITGDATDIQQQLDPSHPATISLPSGGSYRLESWANPCDGNCGYLDGPTDRCTATLPVDDGAVTKIEITAPVGHACSIDPTPPQ